MTNLDHIAPDVNNERGPFLQDNVVGLKKALFTVTFFESQSAQTMYSQQITLGQLRHYIQTARKPKKDQLRWLKLASFGNKRSNMNCLRHDANVLSISGIELDYDSKVMQLDEAIGIAQKAELLALLYTTASYTAATPKWRILLPTSKPLKPEERAKLVARVNGLYGDIFDQASFALSQSYYFGCVGDNPEHRAVITEGDFIDLRDDLDAGAISKSGTIGQSDDDTPPLVRGNGGDPDDPYFILEDALLDSKPAWTPENEDRIWKALCCIPANLIRTDWVEIGMVLHWLHWVDDDGFDWGLEAWDKWSQTSDGQGPGEKGGGYKSRWDIERRWDSFSGEKQKLVKTKRLYDIARKYGWKEDIEELEELPLRHVKAKLMQTSAEFVGGFVPPDYLIDGLMQRRFVYSLTGPTGCGKTAIALRIALHVALGLSLGGREVERGRVLIFAGENPDDVRQRWIKLCDEMNIDTDTIEVVFLPGTPEISAKKIREQIDAEAAEHGPFSLVIIDTSAAYYTGNDENDNKSLGDHARMMRTFVNLPGGPTILVTCHPTKTPNMEFLVPRGGGAFLAEVDGNFAAIFDRSTMVTELTTHGKWRGPEFAPFHFQLISGTCRKLQDTKGRSIYTVYAVPITEEQQEEIEKRGITDQDQLLRAMLDNPGYSLMQLAEHLLWRFDNGKPNKGKVQRLMTALSKGKPKLVEKRRDGHYVLTDQGEKEAENTPEDMVKPQAN